MRLRIGSFAFVWMTLAGPGQAACLRAVSRSSVSVPAIGGSGSVRVKANGPGCSWTPSSDAPWLTISPSGSGQLLQYLAGQRLDYKAAPNTTGRERLGTLAVGELRFTVTQAAGTAAPQIADDGIVNAASFMLASPPGRGIAPGSMFSIFGENLGPATAVQANSYPLPTQLGGVSVKINQGAKSFDATLVFVSSGQVNAILPSLVAPGSAQVSVTYNGTAAKPAPISVLSSNFGIFGIAGGAGPGIIQNFNSAADQPLNSLMQPARPGQVVTLWGTGLGALAGGSDRVAPPAGNLPAAVDVTVGGKHAKILYHGRAPCCSGVDEIVFSVPPDAPETCFVPVQVSADGGTYSNVVTMSVSSRPGPCTDSSPFTPLLLGGGNTAWVQLMRANLVAPLDPSNSSSVSLTADLGLAMFRRLGAGGEFAFDVLYSMPSIGTCITYAGNLGLAGENGMTKLLGLTSGAGLDAGASISVSGSAGKASITPSDVLPNSYLGVLGGDMPLLSDNMLPPFLNPGPFTISGAGGKDIGPFRVDVTLAGAATWSNRDQILEVNRSQGVTLTWTGGNDATQLAMIGGISNSATSSASGAFFCLARIGQGSFTVPPSALANLPASALDFENFSGFLFFGTVPNGANLPSFQAPGLDTAFVVPMWLSLKAIGYQ